MFPNWLRTFPTCSCNVATVLIQLNRWRLCSERLTIAASVEARRWSMQKLSGLIRTRFPMTNDCIDRTLNVRPMPNATRSNVLLQFWWNKALPTNRSEEHTSELQSQSNLVCRLLLEKKNNLRRHRGHQLDLL